MLSLAFIRKNPDVVRRAAELKGEPAPVEEILRLDTTWREHLTAAEKIREEQNKLSKEFAKTRDETVKARLREKADTAKSEISVAETDKRELDDLLLRVPNIFHDSVTIVRPEAE